jgi:hypothetical protein
VVRRISRITTNVSRCEKKTWKPKKTWPSNRLHRLVLRILCASSAVRNRKRFTKAGSERRRRSTGGIIPNGSGIIPTGKYEVVCVAGSSADCKVTVWNESTDYPLATSARVSATPRQFCFGSLIDTPSGDRVQLSSSSGSDKVRVYYPNGEPVLDPATGSPVLKLSQAFGFTSRARLGLSDLRCSDFY